MNFKLAFVLLTLVAIVFASKQEPDIIEFLQSDARFSTLLVAIEAADLVETLQGAGPFTLFAPTNDAFDKIPSEDLEALLQDKEALTAVLLRHLLGFEFYTEGLPNGFYVFTTVGGEDIVVFSDDGCGKKCTRAKYVTVTSASGTMGVVVQADFYNSNGWVQAIDTVI